MTIRIGSGNNYDNLSGNSVTQNTILNPTNAPTSQSIQTPTRKLPEISSEAKFKVVNCKTEQLARGTNGGGGNSRHRVRVGASGFC